MDLAHRIATRYLLADSIGDPEELLRSFRGGVEKFAALEPQAKKLLELHQRVLDAYKHNDLGEAYKLEGQWLTTDYNDVANVGVAAELIFRRLHDTGARLFLAILQQYALPIALTKKVQMAARYWSKRGMRFKRIKGPGEKLRRLPEVLAYPNILKALRAQLEIAQQALRQGKPHEEGANKLNAGPFTVVNTGAFNEKVMQQVVKTVEIAARKMREIGLAKVCYGDVLVSNTLTSQSNILAFYLVQKDEMFVRANVHPDSDIVRTICHELAHRLEHKFLRGKSAEIKRLYRRIDDASDEAGSIPSSEWPEQGKTIEYQGRPLTVVKVDPYRKAIKFKDPEMSRKELAKKGIKEDEPGYDRLLNSVIWTAPLQLWLQKYEGKPPPPPPDIGWVTHYAKKNPSENFAEMVSFWAMGDLKPQMVEMLKAIID